MVREQIEIMEAAERYDFHSVWTAEHHFSEYGFCASPALAIAAVARTTTKIRLGSGIVVLPFNHPLRVAEDFAMLDLLTDGRIDLGIGRGYQPTEFAGYGIDQSKSSEMFDESIDVILKAWSQETFSHRGKYYRFDNVSVRPRPLQSPRPPIWMAAISEGSFEKAGRLGLNLLCSPVFGGSLEVAERGIHRYWRALEENGHDPARHEIAALCAMYCGATQEQSRAEFAGPVTWYFQHLGKYVAPKVGQPPIAGYESYEDVARMLRGIRWDDLVAHGAVFCGDADYMIEQMRLLKDNFGINHVLGWTRVGGLAAELVEGHLERMRDKVMPALV